MTPTPFESVAHHLERSEVEVLKKENAKLTKLLSSRWYPLSIREGLADPDKAYDEAERFVAAIQAERDKALSRLEEVTKENAELLLETRKAHGCDNLCFATNHGLKTPESGAPKSAAMPEWWPESIRKKECVLGGCMACAKCCHRINSQLEWSLGELSALRAECNKGTIEYNAARAELRKLSAQEGVFNARQVEELLDRAELRADAITPGQHVNEEFLANFRVEIRKALGLESEEKKP